MESEREYLSEMDIFKVLSQSNPIKIEAKVFPEKGMSPKSKEKTNTSEQKDVSDKKK